MLKFRNTRSIKAKRAAEKQLQSLDDKLKMDWIWKPMAAAMNENESDLIYWEPPLYSSPFLSKHSKQFSGSFSSTSSSECSPAVNSQTLQKKRKLAQRRSRIIQNETQNKPVVNEQNKTAVSRNDSRGKLFEHSSSRSVRSEQDLHLHNSTQKSLSNDKLHHNLKVNWLLRIFSKIRQQEKQGKLTSTCLYGNHTSCSIKRNHRPSLRASKVKLARNSLKHRNIRIVQQIMPENGAVIRNTINKKSFCNKTLPKTSFKNELLMTIHGDAMKSNSLQAIFKILAILYRDQLDIYDNAIYRLNSKVKLQEEIIKKLVFFMIKLKKKFKCLELNSEAPSFGTHIDNAPSVIYHPTMNTNEYIDEFQHYLPSPLHHIRSPMNERKTQDVLPHPSKNTVIDADLSVESMSDKSQNKEVHSNFLEVCKHGNEETLPNHFNQTAFTNHDNKEKIYTSCLTVQLRTKF